MTASGLQVLAGLASFAALVAVVLLSSSRTNTNLEASKPSILPQVRTKTQKLGGMFKYDDASGLLRILHSEPGLALRFYWGHDYTWGDISGPWSDLRAGLGEPKAATFTADLNYPQYDDLADMSNNQLPGNSTEEYAHALVVVRGRIQVVKGGEYTFSLESASPAVMNVSAADTDKETRCVSTYNRLRQLSTQHFSLCTAATVAAEHKH